MLREVGLTVSRCPLKGDVRHKGVQIRYVDSSGCRDDGIRGFATGAVESGRVDASGREGAGNFGRGFVLSARVWVRGGLHLRDW